MTFESDMELLAEDEGREITAKFSRDELVRGWREEEPDPAFELRWDIALGPWASAERWVSSNWRGDASLVTGPLPERPVVWAARPAGRWRVEARIGGGDRDALHIAGTFVA